MSGSNVSAHRPWARRHVVVIGGGVIGASWAALFLANGLTVTVSDPDPEIETKVNNPDLVRSPDTEEPPASAL